MAASKPPAAPDLGDDPLKLDRQVCFALAVASRTVISLYRPLLEPLGLTHPQYLVMLALWERSPRSVKDITEAIQLDSATLSPLLKRLEAAGLVTRTRRAADERVVDLELTAKGRGLRERALAVPYAVVAQLRMDVDDLMDLHARLTDLIAAALSAVQRAQIG
ncbi:MAG: putative transcriptional regulator [Frankiales bacterium]|nr:putative transcriptional regulator [Frankiales bacterium]